MAAGPVFAGAALSMEGAYQLGTRLGAVDSATADLHTLHSAFADYQDAHAARVAQCRTVTAFTQLLGTPSSRMTEAIRDSMRFVPQPMNGWVFDAFLDYSLGDLPARTRSKWPLDVHGARARGEL